MRSIRSVATEMGLSRNTVQKYLNDEVEPGRRPTEEGRDRPARDACEKKVVGLLETRRWTKKQRATSRRLGEMLGELGIKVSDRTVRRVLQEWRRQKLEVGIPLAYRPGDLVELDFFEVLVEVGGEQQKAWVFLLRSTYAEKDFAWLYRWQDQACFLGGLTREPTVGTRSSRSRAFPAQGRTEARRRRPRYRGSRVWSIVRSSTRRHRQEASRLQRPAPGRSGRAGRYSLRYTSSRSPCSDLEIACHIPLPVSAPPPGASSKPDRI
jgi:hypothetical protein